MTDLAVYGLPNCDTCRKAQKFLESAGVSFTFHDLRNPPVTAAQLRRWLAAIDAGQLVNKRSTTWRQLSRDQQDRALAGDAALLQQHPTLIKRPLVEWGGEVSVGFKADVWQAKLP